MTLAHHSETAMKTSKRIATLLIVSVLGIITNLQAGAWLNLGDSSQFQDDPYKKQKFTGIIIDPNPSDQLLYTRHADFVNENCPQNALLVTDKKTESGMVLIKNTFSDSNRKRITNCSPIVNIGNSDNLHQENPKK